MKRFIPWLLKFIRKTLITVAIISIIAFGISKLTGASLADTFQYSGFACILFGMFSLVGKMGMSTGPAYFQSLSVSSKSISEGMEEDFKSRDGNFKFLGFMAFIGTLLILIGMGFLHLKV